MDTEEEGLTAAQVEKAKRGIYVKGYIDECPVDFLIDTGATDTFISVEQYERLAGAGLPTLLPDWTWVSLANGDPLEVTGRMQILVSLGGSRLMVPVTVAPIACPAILGLDYLLMSGGVLDMPKLQLHCGGRSIPLRDEKAEPFIGRILAESTMMIPAGGEAVLSGTLEG